MHHSPAHVSPQIADTFAPDKDFRGYILIRMDPLLVCGLALIAIIGTAVLHSDTSAYDVDRLRSTIRGEARALPS